MAAVVCEMHMDSCCFWNAVVGEELPCQREPTNTVDRYAVAVLSSGRVVAHLLKKISRICSLFLENIGDIHCITCTVHSNHRYSAELPQGGLEILVSRQEK